MNDTFCIPSNFQLVYQPQAIAGAVERMGRDIGVWADQVWRESHTDLLAIPILRGAIFFFADLVRAIPHSVEIAPARTWAYEDTENNKQRPQVQVNLEQVPAKGRSVLLVDDICDSGRTLHVLKQALLQAGARVVKSAVLVKRELPGENMDPDWIGFTYKGPEWLVGYGMDDCDRFRNLPGVYTILQAEKK
ncbi:MAG: hypothetical protein DCC75_00580 [Proteobacteria bacterium]|nr:MAG: hypothetical protein DCC75_00580 [Pseudomonadota bacterium]